MYLFLDTSRKAFLPGGEWILDHLDEAGKAESFPELPLVQHHLHWLWNHGRFHITGARVLCSWSPSPVSPKFQDWKSCNKRKKRRCGNSFHFLFLVGCAGSHLRAGAANECFQGCRVPGAEPLRKPQHFMSVCCTKTSSLGIRKPLFWEYSKQAFRRIYLLFPVQASARQLPRPREGAPGLARRPRCPRPRSLALVNRSCLAALEQQCAAGSPA